MSAKVLIVEDEMLVAFDLEASLEELGYEPVGIAPDMAAAMAMAERQPDVALVDLNLRDGLTGPQIGARLGEHGTAVVFMTANPRLLDGGVDGTIGVLPKPCDCHAVGGVVDFALRARHGDNSAPPAGLQVFAAQR